MKLSNLKPNPQNPRIIKDDKFKKLVKSLTEFPEMMEKRPMVCVTDVDGKMFPLGGNMRLRAIQELGMKEIPDTWVTLADDWTEEKRKEFTIKDNASFGEWDWDDLANEWDADLLSDWGMDVPLIFGNPQYPTEKDVENDFDNEMKKINDENCQMPIVPKLHEKHSFFIIAVDNEIDEAFIRNRFNLLQSVSVDGRDDKLLSNFIPFKEFQRECLLKS